MAEALTLLPHTRIPSQPCGEQTETPKPAFLPPHRATHEWRTQNPQQTLPAPPQGCRGVPAASAALTCHSLQRCTPPRRWCWGTAASATAGARAVGRAELSSVTRRAQHSAPVPSLILTFPPGAAPQLQLQPQSLPAHPAPALSPH